ncbi:MAG: D-alanyl-D-alanine carboxypeptidase [Clostridiales bacterium]|nr:D-alanyl-D-alanine carboxypeptidase [Clostridiales bacterium]
MALPIALVFDFYTAKPVFASIDEGVQAASYVLMDAGTGQVLMEKEMHAQCKPASITKVMTTLLALEKGGPSDSVHVSHAAVAANPSDGSSAGIMPGEVIALDELLYAVMLESANEAANAAAEFVSGTMEDFAVRMTQRAEELGAQSTHFANANGLNDDDHYTSAYDMALITREAIQLPRFLQIWGTYQHYMPATNLQPTQRILNNKNRMLPLGALPYPGILGGKTGYTNASGNTLVEAASRDGRTLICVLMQGASALANFHDAALLLDYGFEAFRTVTYEDETYEKPYSFLLHNDLSFDQVRVSFGPPSDNADGSASVVAAFSVPVDSRSLMYPDIGAVVLTRPAPPQSPAPDTGVADTVESASLSPLGRALSGLSRLAGLLPPWLTLLMKVVFGTFAALFILACIFRTRRWLRRRKRLARKKQLETRRRAYREQQSFWS